MLEIPCTPQGPHFSQRTEIDGATYIFEFEWNERAQSWFLHLANQDNEPLVSGVRIIADWPLLHRDTGVFLGQLIAIDTTGKGESPAFQDLGERVKLVYIQQVEAEGVI